MVDENYATHLFSYQFDGGSWTIDIRARDADEAQRRLKALAWATYDGVLVARVPVPAAGPLTRLANRLRNVARTFLS